MSELNNGRRACEIMIRKHAERGGYDVDGATETPISEGLTQVTWSTPDGPMKVNYKYTPSENDDAVAPLHIVVTAEDRKKQVDRLAHAEAVLAGNWTPPADELHG